MQAVVADTGPLNYLVLIDQVRVVPALFGAVSIPEAVRTELGHPEAPPIVRRWISSLPSWLVVRPVADAGDGDVHFLDEGEREAILLALSLNATLLVIDDRAGVAVARRKSLVVTGTIGLLDLAARQGLVDLSEAFKRLRKTSFRCRPELFDAVLAKHCPGP